MIDTTHILAQVDALPPLPGTSVRLMIVMGDPTATIEQIVEVVRYDQALTARILQLCNSAYFGRARQIDSLNEAMIALGTMKVLQLVMAVHTSAILAAPREGYGLAAGAMWEHSVATALASTHFARKLKIVNVNLAFTAGLLHDIGKVVLSRFVAAEFARIVEMVRTQKRAFVEAEREVLGIDHTEIGSMVAQQWKLPEPLVRCIRYHHEPAALDPTDPLVDAVYLANCVCLLLGIGLGADGLYTRADETVMQRAGLNEHDLETAGLAVLEELHGLTAWFNEQSSAKKEPQPAGK